MIGCTVISFEAAIVTSDILSDRTGRKNKNLSFKYEIAAISPVITYCTTWKATRRTEYLIAGIK